MKQDIVWENKEYIQYLRTKLLKGSSIYVTRLYLQDNAKKFIKAVCNTQLRK